MSGAFFGGLFDFNQDGKTDLSEQFLAFMMMQETMREENDEQDSMDILDENN